MFDLQQRIHHWAPVIPKLIVVVGFVFGSLSPSHVAQTTVDTGWAEAILAESLNGDNKQRSVALKQIADRLSVIGKEDREIMDYATVLRIKAELLELNYPRLNENVTKSLDTVSRTSKAQATDRAKMELLQQMAFAATLMRSDSFTPDDVERFTKATKTALKWWDEIKDPSLLGAQASTMSKVAAVADGLAKLESSISDASARKAYDGLSSILGQLKTSLPKYGVNIPNTFSIVQMPAEVATVIADESRQIFRHSTDFIDGFADVLENRPGAIERMHKSRDELAKRLSPQNYGRAMLGAITDNLLKKIPFTSMLWKWSTRSPSYPQTEIEYLWYVRDQASDKELDWENALNEHRNKLKNRLQAVRKEDEPIKNGYGVALVTHRSAGNRVSMGTVSHYVLTDHTGNVVKPEEHHYSWFVLKPGTYRIRAVLWTSVNTPVVEFDVVGGQFSEVSLGGRTAYGRVEVVNSVKNNDSGFDYFWVYPVGSESPLTAKEFKAQAYVDLPNGEYMLQFKSGNKPAIWLPKFYVVAGQSTVISLKR